MTPPQNIIDAAARWSPCQKSKRGAVVFYMYSDQSRGMFIASGFNGPPGGLPCNGDAECFSLCGRRCVHAEARAIRGAVLRAKSAEDGGAALDGLHLLHVKIVDGELVAGGPPSCWQCSREILDAGIEAMWLFESNIGWRCYTAREFHEVTWRNVETP